MAKERLLLVEEVYNHFDWEGFLEEKVLA